MVGPARALHLTVPHSVHWPTVKIFVGSLFTSPGTRVAMADLEDEEVAGLISKVGEGPRPILVPGRERHRPTGREPTIGRHEFALMLDRCKNLKGDPPYVSTRVPLPCTTSASSARPTSSGSGSGPPCSPTPTTSGWCRRCCATPTRHRRHLRRVRSGGRRHRREGAERGVIQVGEFPRPAWN